jgi:hypothetical protein
MIIQKNELLGIAICDNTLLPQMKVVINAFMFTLCYKSNFGFITKIKASKEEWAK